MKGSQTWQKVRYIAHLENSRKPSGSSVSPVQIRNELRIPLEPRIVRHANVRTRYDAQSGKTTRMSSSSRPRRTRLARTNATGKAIAASVIVTAAAIRIVLPRMRA
jgi:hypothetical protein